MSYHSILKKLSLGGVLLLSSVGVLADNHKQSSSELTVLATTCQDVVSFFSNANNYAMSQLRLANDVDCSGHSANFPLDKKNLSNAPVFNASIEGARYTLILPAMNTSEANGYALGLISRLGPDGQIKNLNVETGGRIFSSNTHPVGVVAGINDGSIRGVNIQLKHPVEGVEMVGGAVGVNRNQLEIVTVNKELNQQSNFFGYVRGQFQVGGVVGKIDNKGVNPLNNILTNVDVLACGAVGGAVGYIDGRSQAGKPVAFTAKINDVRVTGDVTIGSGKLCDEQAIELRAGGGGLIGVVTGNVDISNSSALGNVTQETIDVSVTSLGGLIGSIYNGEKVTLFQTYAEGRAESKEKEFTQDGIMYVGGSIYNDEKVTLFQTYAEGRVESKEKEFTQDGVMYVGGLIGSIVKTASSRYIDLDDKESIVIERSYATGDVIAPWATGGLIGALGIPDVFHNSPLDIIAIKNLRIEQNH